MSKRWIDRIADEQKMAVQAELRKLGLETNQVRSVLHSRRTFSFLELRLMLGLPRNELSGQKPSLWTVRAILHDLNVLGLIERSDKKKPKGFLRTANPKLAMDALCKIVSLGAKPR